MEKKFIHPIRYWTRDLPACIRVPKPLRYSRHKESRAPRASCCRTVENQEVIDRLPMNSEESFRTLLLEEKQELWTFCWKAFTNQEPVIHVFLVVQETLLLPLLNATSCNAYALKQPCWIEFECLTLSSTVSKMYCGIQTSRPLTFKKQACLLNA
jgi:hypothetical protein